LGIGALLDPFFLSGLTLGFFYLENFLVIVAADACLAGALSLVP
jgi:hypothetical protein